MSTNTSPALRFSFAGGCGWDRFFTTNLGFGIGVADHRDDGARVFGLVSNSVSEPVVLLSEDAVVALIAVREGRLP